MTTDRDFDRLARAWLEAGPDEAPDRVVAAILQAAETTPQVRRRLRWPLWRPITMNRLPVAAGAVAVLTVAMVGGALLLSRSGPTTGVGGPPASTPTPTATPAPTPRASASAKAVPLTLLDTARTIGPDTYRVGNPFDAPFKFTSTADFTVSNLSQGEFQIHGGPNDSAYVEIDLIADVFADPCRGDSAGGVRASPVPRTVAGIVAGLAEMKSFSMGPTTDIVIDGHAGKEFDLSNSLDPQKAACDGGALIPIWTKVDGSRTSTNPGAKDHIAVIDVDGTPVGIAWAATAEFKPDLDRMIRALDFE